MIDLHTHTTLSDGTISPEELVLRAIRLGLKAIAVTDHDTVAGVRRAQSQGNAEGLEVIAGVEISAEWTPGIMHILGYFINPDSLDLLGSLEWLAKARRDRIIDIVDLLRDLGVDISAREVNAEADEGVPGRPHVANVMVRKGFVSGLQEAFDRFLRRGAPAYVVKRKLSPQKAIQLISKAGGLPVLAHPYSLREDDSGKLERIVNQLREMGLEGIEAYYSIHTEEQTKAYLGLATRLGLVISGGSDFHGANKPDIELGRIPIVGRLPYGILEDLKIAHARGRGRTGAIGTGCPNRYNDCVGD